MSILYKICLVVFSLSLVLREFIDVITAYKEQKALSFLVSVLGVIIMGWLLTAIVIVVISN